MNLKHTQPIVFSKWGIKLALLCLAYYLIMLVVIDNLPAHQVVRNSWAVLGITMAACLAIFVNLFCLKIIVLKLVKRPLSIFVYMLLSVCFFLFVDLLANIDSIDMYGRKLWRNLQDPIFCATLLPSPIAAMYFGLHLNKEFSSQKSEIDQIGKANES